MFGYIRPRKSDLLVKDSEYYSALYCGLCRYGGKHISHITRWLLNYDFVLLALLRISLTGEKAEVCREYCPYKCKKKNCVKADASYDYVISAFGLLSYGKLIDDINDEKGIDRAFKKFAKRAVFERIKRKSSKYPSLVEAVDKGLAKCAKAEKDRVSDTDFAADGFGAMMREIASFGLEGEKKLIAENCGYHIGRFIYIADALDDAFNDEKTGNYNPLLLKYGSAAEVYKNRETITSTLYDSLNAFSNSYALACKAELTEEDRIIFNIVELGGRDSVRRIIERNKKHYEQPV
ncbi:MAG: hypothetical protein J5793_01170 [Clostridia bacterium]|nr:hypothetical protein [Clostridia bacterium]